MEYIRGEKQDGCLFCEKPKESRDEENLILARGEHSFVMLNAYPYNNGHLLISPYLHLASLEGLPDPVGADLLKSIRRSLGVLRAALKPDGINLGLNLGKAAGAGIDAHLHFHLVPRWAGDNNFMTVVSEVRVVPQHLIETYRELKPHFERSA
jgi:ATP adenylyltransferase